MLENTIFDPLSTGTINGVTVRNVFPGNIIPRNRFDPVAAKIQDYFPLPSRPGLQNNWQQVATTVRKNEVVSVKMDHSLTDKSRLNFFVQSYRAKFGNNGADGLAPPLTAKRLGGSTAPTVRLNSDYTLSPTLILHLGAGVVREHIPDQAVPGVYDFDQAGVLGLHGALTPGFPRITGLSNGNFGGMSLGIGPTNANQYYAVKPTGVASLTWVRASHTMKFGARLADRCFHQSQRSEYLRRYNFGSGQTGDLATQGVALTGGSIGFGYASFLLGAASSATIANPQDPQYRKSATAVFAQDTWKVTRRLTLDYGLRWDYQTPMRELWNRFSEFDPGRPNPAAGNLLGATSYEGSGSGRCNCRFAATYPYAFGPRIGVAYQINSKTVFRAGGGVTYSQTANFNYMGTTIGTGFNTLNINSPSFGMPALYLRDGLQYDRSLLYSATLDPGIRPTAGQIDTPSAWVDPDGGRPAQGNAVERRSAAAITPNFAIDANYVGNRGAWFQANIADRFERADSRTAGGLRPGHPQRGRPEPAHFANQFDDGRAARVQQAALPGLPNRADGGAEFAAVPAIRNTGQPLVAFGDSWYDSLQVKATKRHSHGLDATVSFTWQKELLRGSDDQGGGGGSINDVFNRPNQKYISGNSQPLVLVFAVNYQMPGLGARPWMKHVTGGWTLSTISRYASGLPIPVPGSSTSLLGSLLFRGTRMNRVPGNRSS